MTTENRIGALIRVASQLIEVMNREVEILRQMRPNDIEPLQQEKVALSALYEERVRELAAEPNALQTIGPALRQEFADVASRFNQAMADNERALHAARTAHNRLIQAVIAAVEEIQMRPQGYAADGAKPGTGVAGRQASGPLALDTRL